MKVHIRRRGVKVTEKLRRFVWSCLKAALGKFSRYVSEVWVFLRDTSEMREEMSKKCRIVVSIPPAARVVVVGVHEKVPAAIKATTGRARRAVVRHIKRRLALRRRWASRRPNARGVVRRLANGKRRNASSRETGLLNREGLGSFAASRRKYWS